MASSFNAKVAAPQIIKTERSPTFGDKATSSTTVNPDKSSSNSGPIPPPMASNFSNEESTDNLESAEEDGFSDSSMLLGLQIISQVAETHAQSKVSHPIHAPKSAIQHKYTSVVSPLPPSQVSSNNNPEPYRYRSVIKNPPSKADNPTNLPHTTNASQHSPHSSLQHKSNGPQSEKQTLHNSQSSTVEGASGTMDAEIIQAANLLFNTFNSNFQNQHNSSYHSSYNQHHSAQQKQPSFNSQVLSGGYASSSSSSPSPSPVSRQFKPKQKRTAAQRDPEWYNSSESSEDDNDEEFKPEPAPTTSTANTGGSLRAPKSRNATSRKRGSPKKARKGEDSSGPKSTAGTLVTGRVCSFCGATVTPMWRHGPPSYPDLCNRCGVKHMRGRLLPAGE